MDINYSIDRADSVVFVMSNREMKKLQKNIHTTHLESMNLRIVLMLKAKKVNGKCQLNIPLKVNIT